MVLSVGVLVLLAMNGSLSDSLDPSRRTGVANAGNSAVPPPLPEVGRPDAAMEGEGLLTVSMDDARSINAARPINPAAIPPAPALNSRLTGPDYDRAVSCLAVAALYEAGGNVDDQRPVIQVILNRVRHPAFPNSVCGVVFQGQERRTGCQFSFTCDGALLRWRPGAGAYQRARTLATEMLKTDIDQRVGLATHYHTDWVVPYWSASLDKVAAVKTHLFFRWNGYWGTRSAFVSIPSLKEPIVPRIASFDANHASSMRDAGDGTVPVFDLLPGVDATTNPLAGSEPGTLSLPTEQPLILERLAAGAGVAPGRWSLNAVELCGNRANCRLVGWSGTAPGSRMTRADFIANPPDFVYVQNLPNRTQQAYWNCERFPAQGSAKCLGSAANALRLATGG